MASRQRRPAAVKADSASRERVRGIPDSAGIPTAPELLSANDRAKIRGLLNVEENFGVIARSFVEAIPVLHQFEGCCYITLNLLKGPTSPQSDEQQRQRLASFNIINHVYRSASDSINPFLPWLKEVASERHESDLERYFVSLLLTGEVEKVLTLTPAEWLRWYHNCSALPSVLYPSDRSEERSTVNNSNETGDPACAPPPPWYRPIPPLLPIQHGEMEWMLPDDTAEVRRREEEVVKAELKALMAKSIHVPLDPLSVQGLVTNNPAIALQALGKLSDTPHMSDFLHHLCSMELSLHSMVVVSKLTEAVALPPYFVHRCIRNGIHTCEESKVAAFCVEFSQVKEAAELFRLLKALE